MQNYLTVYNNKYKIWLLVEIYLKLEIINYIFKLYIEKLIERGVRL